MTESVFWDDITGMPDNARDSRTTWPVRRRTPGHPVLNSPNTQDPDSQYSLPCRIVTAVNRRSKSQGPWLSVWCRSQVARLSCGWWLPSAAHSVPSADPVPPSRRTCRPRSHARPPHQT